MSNRIQLKSTESLVDMQGYTRIDAAVALTVDLLSDGSLAYNVYTRLGDQVYEDTSESFLGDAVLAFKRIGNAVSNLQVALKNCDLDSPVPAKPKPYVPDYTQVEQFHMVRDVAGRTFPGMFRWYVWMSHRNIDAFPIAGFLSFYEAQQMCAELQELDAKCAVGIKEGGSDILHYVVEV